MHGAESNVSREEEEQYMKLWKKIAGLCVVAGAVYIGSTVSVSSNSPVPGSIDDPIVSKSYVDEQIAKLRLELTGKVSAPVSSPAPAPTPEPTPAPAPAPNPPGTGSGGAQTLVVEELQAGQTLIGGAGTEIIVRTGKAVVVTNSYGEGIPDVTGGKDLKGNVPLNHLLLVPRSDGRGVRVTEGPCFIMVRGEYMIQ